MKNKIKLVALFIIGLLFILIPIIGIEFCRYMEYNSGETFILTLEGAIVEVFLIATAFHIITNN